MARQFPQLLISDAKGKISILESVEAAGMKAGHPFRLSPQELVKLPPASQVFMLPERAPVGYSPEAGAFVAIPRNPSAPKDEPCFAVAAFTAPGYTLTYSASYQEIGKPQTLPLYAYGAVASYGGDLYAAAMRVDKDKRHDARFIDIGLVRRKAREFKKIFPRNRLVSHLETCALVYNCPNAQNFFLSRYECPLPTSPTCNAMCAGCISYQPGARCKATQPRIAFVPTPEEIAEIALYHIERVDDPVASFGQGCEGEPLLAAGVIEKAIRLIRQRTDKGIINMNTNASKPAVLARLFDAGLDSMRVSINSVRKPYYTRYYKPRYYTFSDVLSSIRLAKKKGVFVSLNYLAMPGFTDSEDEFNALKRFIGTYKIDMIQWRNLNFDPLQYFREIKASVSASYLLGIREIMKRLKREYPRLMMGYFNPALSKMKKRS